MLRPASWVLQFGRLVKHLSFLQDHLIRTRMALVWCHETDAAVLVLMVVPMHKSLGPFPCTSQVGKSLAWVLWAVFECAKEGFDVGVVIGDPWS